MTHDAEERSNSGPRLRVRMGLRGQLTASHLFVGIAVSVLALVTAHRLEGRDEQVAGIRTETVRGATALSSIVNSAFEEGFSAILTRDQEDRTKFFARLAELRRSKAVLAAREDVTEIERRQLKALDGLAAVAENEGAAMFVIAATHDGQVRPQEIERFDKAMDRLRDHTYGITELVSTRATADATRSRALWGWAAVGIGLAASVLALGLGSALGGRFARPILRLREAAGAFERGDPWSVDVTRDDEIGDLARAFDHTAGSVGRLVREISRRNADNRLLLDNVAQGLFTVDAKGVIAGEYSAALARWFGAPNADESIGSFATRIDAKFGASTRFAFEQVVDDFLPLECTLPQMPSRLVLGNRHYGFAYQEIRQADRASGFLVVVTDVTSDIERDAAESRRRETVALLERMLEDPTGVQAFVEEGDSLIEELHEAPASPSLSVRRALHTLKGNSALYGLESVATFCHGIEARIAEGSLLTQEEVAQLADMWRHRKNSISCIVDRAEDRVELSVVEHRELLDVVRRREPLATIEQMLLDLTREPTARPLARHARLAQAIAGRLDKRVDVLVEDNGLRLDQQRWASFWGAFVHAVRNAVDHGIEQPDDRVRAGKAEEGHLWFRTRVADNRLFVELEDDGRGIDFDAVRAKCEDASLPSDSKADLVRALLGGGISTADTVTDLSGRGVGVSALAEACAALGGETTLESVGGRGTLLRMMFPAGSMYEPTGAASGSTKGVTCARRQAPTDGSSEAATRDERELVT